MNKEKTVILGLSGGVDSSVAALLLKKQGYKVIAVFMKNYSDNKDPLTGKCDYLKDKRMAQRIAHILKIPFIFLDSEKDYKNKVMKPMFEGYEKGLTPNPDILCNKVIKFPLLLNLAKKYKADFISTGHYARIKKSKQGFSLLTGKDKTKDQSYFLAQLNQQQLAHTLFPLGNFTKDNVRNIAKKNNLPNWNKHGTVGICFVGKTSFHNLIKKEIKSKKGKVIDTNGNYLGTHLGTSYYTIGQKAGEHIGIEIKKPKELSQKRLYIAERRKNNILVLAEKEHPSLKKGLISLKSIHFINPADKSPLNNIKARIRHLGSLYPGKLIKKNKTYYFNPLTPIHSIAPGQFIVLYNKDKLIASGEIEK